VGLFLSGAERERRPFTAADERLGKEVTRFEARSRDFCEDRTECAALNHADPKVLFTLGLVAVFLCRGRAVRLFKRVSAAVFPAKFCQRSICQLDADLSRQGDCRVLRLAIFGGEFLEFISRNAAEQLERRFLDGLRIRVINDHLHKAHPAHLCTGCDSGRRHHEQRQHDAN